MNLVIVSHLLAEDGRLLLTESSDDLILDLLIPGVIGSGSVMTVSGDGSIRLTNGAMGVINIVGEGQVRAVRGNASTRKITGEGRVN